MGPNGIRNMSIKLIIFDFDGTLGDTRRNIVVTMQDVMKENAAKNGYIAEIVAEGEHYDYLARITKMNER